MRSVVAAVAVLAAVSLSACSSDSNGDPSVASSDSVASTSSGPTGFPSSSSSSSSPSSSASVPATSASGSGAAGDGVLSESEATAALVTATDVGAGFTQSQETNDSDPLPCEPNQPSLDERYPSDVEVEADFGGASGNAFFGEQIQTFDSASTVAQVIAAGEKGLSCGTATVNGQVTTISSPTDLTNDVGAGVDKAEGWTITSKAANASIIVVQIGQHLVVFSFAATPTVDTTALPDAQTLVTAGVAKVVAAL